MTLFTVRLRDLQAVLPGGGGVPSDAVIVGGGDAVADDSDSTYAQAGSFPDYGLSPWIEGTVESTPTIPTGIIARASWRWRYAAYLANDPAEPYAGPLSDVATTMTLNPNLAIRPAASAGTILFSPMNQEVPVTPEPGTFVTSQPQSDIPGTRDGGIWRNGFPGEEPVPRVILGTDVVQALREGTLRADLQMSLPNTINTGVGRVLSFLRVSEIWLDFEIGRTPLRVRQRASGVTGSTPLRLRSNTPYGLRTRQDSNR